jgi:hypothetical protein
MKTRFLMLPLLLAAVSLAAAEATPEELVEKLGSPDYATREQATKDLIAMGERAVPALRKALESKDLEVSLRAGRALRAIEGPRRGAAAEEPAEAPSGRATASQLSIEIRDGKVKVRRKVVEDGKETVKEYEGESIEQLKRDHPELRDVLGNFELRSGRDALEMEDFWREWGSEWNEDFWRRWNEDMRRDLERMRRWQQELLRRRGLAEPPADSPRGRRAGALLGVEVTPPDDVLAAQLDLGTKGLVVRTVHKGTLAERLGIQRYDVLISLNGHEIAGREDVARALEGRKPEDRAVAVVIRKAKLVDLATPE